MAETQKPDDGGDLSPVNQANVHFFRPNDGIYVSDGPEHRTICVSPHLPPAMARNGDWHVEQFELHKELYRGKTSLLYMATDRVSGVQVALKLYRKRKLSVLNRYQVEREVRLHINLHHENIIHLFAAFEDEKHVYMVQEFAVCGDLFEDLKKGGGQLKEKYAVRDVIVPFLSALAYLHSQGIIHRDIKPENILLGANKTVKVADFGLSININHERPVTRAGTLDYMAPEVLVCPDKRRPEENKDKVLLGYTAQVDSWAVGILAYELLVGYPPFEQESRAATYEHIMYKDPKFPSWMTDEAKKFIGLALCKNASQRPTVFDLMQHAWVQPYMVRHPPTGATTPLGPSRLRNSVSLMSDEAAREAREAQQLAGPSTSASGMTGLAGGQAHTYAHAQPTGSGSSSGMMPAPPATTSVRALAHQSSQAASHRAASTSHGAHHSTERSPQQGGPGSRTPGGGASASLPLKSSASLQVQPPPGSQEPITGSGVEGSRLHDSLSDPTIRTFEGQNPHPPGATAAASLRIAVSSRSVGGVDLERSGSIASSTSMSGGGAARTPMGGASGNLASRLGQGHLSPRPSPPPLTLEPLEVGSEGSSDAMPMSPSTTASMGGGGHRSGPTPPLVGRTLSVTAQPPAMPPGPGTPQPPRHRMASLIPPVNTSFSGAAGQLRMPAPPISPKPLTPEIAPGYHRPASGVLSDDSFLPPARAPSMSFGGQHLSPLQAALLAPRPGSRLNSPSHSRRNSLSQAGAMPSQLPPGAAAAAAAALQAHSSTPLPQLGGADYGEQQLEEVRSSNSYSHQKHGGGGGGGPGKMFGKLWPGGKDMMGSGMDASLELPSSSGHSFSGRANASPMARSAAAARVRMLAPEDLRPLMRESSISSSTHKSSGGGNLRDELSQPSMTVFHRPGKVPGVGRAALAAARDADGGADAAGTGGGRDHRDLGKAKSLVNRNYNGPLSEDMHQQMSRMGSDAVLARTAAGAALGSQAAGPPGVASQRSFTTANSPFARKLANGAIATKVTEYVKGRLPHDDEMEG